MRRADWALIVGLVTAGLLFLGARTYSQTRRERAVEEQFESLRAFVEGVESLPLQELWLPESIEVPQWICDDSRAAESLTRLARALARAPRAQDIPLETADAPTVSAEDVLNRLLTAELIQRHPEIMSDPLEWAASVERRVDALRRSEADCALYEFGNADQPDLGTKELKFEVNAFRQLQSADEQAQVGAGITAQLRDLESAFATAQQMPVINGEAKGTLPKRGTIVRFCEHSIPAPASQTLSRVSSGNAEFTLRTRDGSGHVYARLIANSMDAWRGFIRAGDSVTVELPSGDYTLRYAMGEDWYGYAYLFGPGTIFSEAGSLIDLRYGYGTTVELVPQVGGNLTEREIDANSF